MQKNNIPEQEPAEVGKKSRAEPAEDAGADAAKKMM